MKSVSIEVPSLSLGTVSLRRSWYRYGAYIFGMACFTLLVLNSKNNSNINLRFQYFEVTDFRFVL